MQELLGIAGGAAFMLSIAAFIGLFFRNFEPRTILNTAVASLLAAVASVAAAMFIG